MKDKFFRLYRWLVISTFENKMFEKYIKHEIIHILDWILHPAYRKRNKFFSLIKENKFIFGLILFFILWTTGFFSMGRWMSYWDKTETISVLEYKLDKTNDIIEVTNEMLNRKDSTISQLRTQMNSRDYLQYIIKRDCHISHYNDLTKLPDDVFFTMIDEVEKYQIPYTIFFRVVDHESGFQFVTNSQGSGALGYLQVMPSTFKFVASKLGFYKHDKVTNIKTGAYLMKRNYNLYRKKGFSTKDSWYKALVDYSGGDYELAAEEMKYFKTGL